MRSSKNDNLPTGAIEVFANDLCDLFRADTPITKDDDNVDENLRISIATWTRKYEIFHPVTGLRLVRDYFDEMDLPKLKHQC